MQNRGIAGCCTPPPQRIRMCVSVFVCFLVFGLYPILDDLGAFPGSALNSGVNMENIWSSPLNLAALN